METTFHRPPTFDQAKNRRQKVRSAGLHPDHWYPVAYDHELAKGQTQEVKFWGKSFALFRGEDGEIRCVENRCAHRQLKLTTGEVKGCNIVCPYHGWIYDGDGKLVDVSHELFGREFPKIKIQSYPTQERYGLIWFFPGDSEKAKSVAIPDIPELEGPDRWACVPVDYTWQCHHSMLIENVCDFSHGYLHRRYQPFSDPKLTGIDRKDSQIYVDYNAKIGAGKIMNAFVQGTDALTDQIQLCYDYPYQWSNTGGWIKHWCFFLPIDERTTRTFFLFYYKNLNLPGTSFPIPRRAMEPLLKFMNRVLVRPVLDEDGFAVEAEQEGYERHFDAPVAELNPVIKEFQALTIERWEDYLAKRDSHPAQRRLPIAPTRGN